VVQRRSSFIPQLDPRRLASRQRGGHAYWIGARMPSKIAKRSYAPQSKGLNHVAAMFKLPRRQPIKLRLA